MPAKGEDWKMKVLTGRHRARRGLALAVVVTAALSVGLVSAPSAGAVGGITWDTSVGTAAPPATVGPYSVAGFGADSRPVLNDVTGVSDPAGSIGFSPALNHRQIGNGWSRGATATPVTCTTPTGR